jgi:SAM-dependent methyltransferase
MTAYVESLRERYFDDSEHPYRILEGLIEASIRPDFTILDAGCGRTAPMLVRYRGRAARLIGVDLVDFTETIDGVELHNWDLGKLDLPDGSVDLIYSRSVMEHVAFPRDVYREMHRVLKPGGRSIFLTANKWDYASIIATIVPNSWHPAIVRRTEGRAECDVFPTQYKTNTKRDVFRFARDSGLDVADFRYLGQYPSYFMFNSALFLLGTAYQKAIEAVPPLNWLQGWLLVTLRKPGSRR